MQFSDNDFRDFFVYLLISWALFLSGCEQNQPQMADGIEDFKSIAQEVLNKLEKGEIKRNSGFFIECAVGNKREKGIRISETVCDKENTRTITIRVTDPTSRPPSQRVETIKLSTLTGDIITVHKGKTKTITNAMTITFDRSGQSVTMVRQFEKTP